MKKAMIAGLASALVLPAVAAADSSVELWGELRGSVAVTDGAHDLGDDTSLSWADNNSRIGVNANLNSGPVQGFVWTEFTLSAGDEQAGSLAERQVFAGVKGNTWEVSYGRRQSAFAWAGERVDPFYDTVAGTGSIDGSYGFSDLTDTFDGDQLAYYGNYMGLAVNAAVFFDDVSGEDDTGLGLGIGYDKGPLNLELQALLSSDNSAIDGIGGETTALRLSGGYKTKMVNFGASVETQDVDGSDGDPVYANLSAGFAAGNGQVNLAVGFVNEDAAAADMDQIEGVGFAAGYWWNMMENTDLHAIVSVVSPEEDDADEVIAVGLGVKHSFSAKLK